MKLRTSNVFAFIIAVSASATLHADIYTWNGSTTGGATGASNVWDTSAANWTGTATVWPATSSTNDDAVFAGTPGTVTLTTSVTANEITFSQTISTAYTIGADSTTGVITLDGTAPTITSAGSSSLNSVGAVISGSAGLAKKGNRTLQIRGACNYTGDTQIFNGNLLIGLGNNRLPVGTSLILGDGVANTSGVFQMNSRSQQVAGLTTAGTGTGNRVINSSSSASTFTVANASDQTFGGILGGTTANDNNYNFTKSAAGRLVLTGVNTFTGTATISGGTLELGHATNTLADTAPVNVNGGTLDIADKADSIGALTVTSGSITGSTGILSAPSCAGKAGTVSAILAGTSNLSGTTTTWLTKDTAGTLELSGANTFTGNITITLGRLTLANSGAVGSVNGTDRKGIIMQGTSRSLWLKGGISVPAFVDIFASSNSFDGGGINNESGNNSIAGPISITTGNGVLNISSASGALTLAGNITATATDRSLLFGGASTGGNTVSGIISNGSTAALPVTKQGVGTWTLSGANTYTGATTVNAGTLVIDGSTAAGSAVTVGGSTATGSPMLSGTGALNGTVNINAASGGAAGTINPGTAGTTGTLTVGSTVIAGTYACDISGSSADKIAVNGDLDITGATLAVSGTPTAPSYTIATYTGSLLGTFTVSPALPSGYTLDTATSGEIRIVSSGTDYDTWINGFPSITGSDKLSTADPDGDGMSNQQEYVYGLIPNSGASVNPIIANLNKTTGTFTYIRRKPSLTGITAFKILLSSDLVNWNEDVSAAQLATAIPSTDNESVVVTLTGAPLGAEKLFVRVSAQ